MQDYMLNKDDRNYESLCASEDGYPNKRRGCDALADKKQKRYHYLHIHTAKISGGTKYDSFTIRATFNAI